MFTMYRDRQKS